MDTKHIKMKPELVAITPQLASEWLQYNVGNRRLPLGNVDFYRRRIESGEFLLTHQALAFEGDRRNPMRLLDGQTRLTAILKTQKTVMQWVFWNCDESTFGVIDGGKPRTFSDHYGWPKDRIAFVNIFHWISSGITKPTKADADAIYSAFGKAFEHLIKTCPTSTKFLSCSAVKSGTVLAMDQDPEHADEIANQYRAMIVAEEQARLKPSVARLQRKLLSIVGGGRAAIMVQFPFTHKAMLSENWRLTKLYGPEVDYFNKTGDYILRRIGK